MFIKHLLQSCSRGGGGNNVYCVLLYVYYCNVPWAAHFDCKTGQYLIQRYVLSVAPSLRVARTAVDTLRYMKGLEEKGHALVVGNQLPIRCGVPLPKAEVEAEFVSELLRTAEERRL